jgi:hypothetical protein
MVGYARRVSALAAFGGLAVLALQGCGSSGSDEAVEDSGLCDDPIDCGDCTVFELIISDPDPDAKVGNASGVLSTITCDLSQHTDGTEDGNPTWITEDFDLEEGDIAEVAPESLRCFGPEFPICLCNYYKWQVLKQFGALDEDFVRAGVDIKDTPLLYATDCEYENMKHQCHGEFGGVVDKSKSTKRTVGSGGVCTCTGTCPEGFA